MSLTSAKWQTHGMGVATAVLHEEREAGKLVFDMRLHWWSERFKSPLIGRDRGAIHLHSFGMESVVLKGTTVNHIVTYEGMFGPLDAVGANLWNCWRYTPEPECVSTGVATIGAPIAYPAGSVWTMPHGVFHYYRTIGDAFTIVRRWHVDIPNDVLTRQGIAQNMSPPVNGRAVRVTMPLPVTLLNLPDNFVDCPMKELAACEVRINRHVGVEVTV